jgi:hypothetical protein
MWRGLATMLGAGAQPCWALAPLAPSAGDHLGQPQLPLP